jgi:hypothetical protein
VNFTVAQVRCTIESVRVMRMIKRAGRDDNTIMRMTQIAILRKVRCSRHGFQKKPRKKQKKASFLE